MPRHGVVLAGGGLTHQESYGRFFAADARCRLLAVADEADVPPSRRNANRRLADELGLPCLGLDDALADPAADIVSICVEPERRGRVAAACAAAGKHLYLDKPLAGTVAEAMRIADAAGRAGVVTQVFSQATTGWARQAHDVLHGGRLGRLIGIHADMLMAKGSQGLVPDGPRREQAAPLTFPADIAKRELHDMGIYPVSLIAWLVGAPATTVAAVTANYFFTEHLERDVEDYAALVIGFANGVWATASCGRIGWMSHPQHGLARVALTGERGFVLCNGPDAALQVFDNGPRFAAPMRHPTDPMGMWVSTQTELGLIAKRQQVPLRDAPAGEDVRAFLDCLETGARPAITAADAVHHLEIIMAGYAAAASGTVQVLRPSL